MTKLTDLFKDPELGGIIDASVVANYRGRAMLYGDAHGVPTPPDVFARYEDFIEKILKRGQRMVVAIEFSSLQVYFFKYLKRRSDREILEHREMTSTSQTDDELLLWLRDRAGDNFRVVPIDSSSMRLNSINAIRYSAEDEAMGFLREGNVNAYLGYALVSILASEMHTAERDPIMARRLGFILRDPKNAVLTITGAAHTPALSDKVHSVGEESLIVDPTFVDAAKEWKVGSDAAYRTLKRVFPEGVADFEAACESRNLDTMFMSAHLLAGLIARAYDDKLAVLATSLFMLGNPDIENKMQRTSQPRRLKG